LAGRETGGGIVSPETAIMLVYLLGVLAAIVLLAIFLAPGVADCRWRKRSGR
jgi:hypothetical protein